MPGFDLALARVQSLQYRRELIHGANLALASQSEIIKAIKTLMQRMIIETQVPREQLHLIQLDRQLDVCVSQVALKQTWIKDMLERAQQATELVSRLRSYPIRLLKNNIQITALLNSKNTQALISNNINLARLAEVSQQDGQTTLALNKSMKGDSSTMKFLAILAVVYVPGTFVAVSCMFLLREHVHFR